MNKSHLLGVMCACLIASSFSSHAALVTGDVLEFSSNSYFALDTNANGTFEEAEKFSITMNEGIRIGLTQTALGSHSGVPDGSETPGIDNPWLFSGNTGMHSTTSPITETSPGSLDFTGWRVDWNGVLINLGGDSLVGDTSLASITCSSSPSCFTNDTYVLDYFAHVLEPDPSGKGGVFYTLHLEGQISAVPVPAAVWLFGSGLLGLVRIARNKKT
ncbi:MAG: VPLPA-CTERM sorting domain-containing protein [Gammaproteobacteria bacterium]|nr:VPLPA-CTERM sorting domain-containing protein [Gammaproteobacteria bacterium]